MICDDKHIEYTYDNFDRKTSTVIHDATHKDRLTKYEKRDSSGILLESKNISYNAYGLPTTGVGSSDYYFTDGGKLFEYTTDTEYINCYYNADGIRTKKIIYDFDFTYAHTIEYILDGTAIVGEKHTLSGITSFSATLYYMYDDNGDVIGFTYSDSNTAATKYYYGKNLQGDVTAIYDRFGMKVVGYTYDAWGNIASTTGTAATTIGTLNPFRYRSYYYDTESGMYYLNARYYNPAICRFISQDTPDVLSATTMSLTDKNLYAYCDNNPVIRKDNGGEFWVNFIVGLATQYVSDVVDNIKNDKTGWDILKPRSSIGTYIGAGISNIIPGSSLGSAVIRNVTSAGIEIAEKVIKDEDIDVLKIASDFVIGTATDFGFGMASQKVTKVIQSKQSRNYSSFAGKQYKKNPSITQEQIYKKLHRESNVNFLAQGLTQAAFSGGQIVSNVVGKDDVYKALANQKNHISLFY